MKNWIRNVVEGRLFKVPWMCVTVPLIADRGQHRVVLEVIRPDADARLVRRHAAGRVAGGDEVDPQPAVREDAVGEDAVARARLAPRRPLRTLEADPVAQPGVAPADRVARAAELLTMTPLTSLPSGALPVMSVPM